MTLGLKLTVYRHTGPLASYVHQFQVLSAEKGADASLLDFGGADVSALLRFGDPLVVDYQAPIEVKSGTLVGPRTRSVLLRFMGNIDQVNIHLAGGSHVRSKQLTAWLGGHNHSHGGQQPQERPVSDTVPTLGFHLESLT